MAKVIEIEVEVGTKKSLKSLNDLEQAQEQLLAKLKQTDLGTAEYARLQKQLKTVGSEIKDLELGFEALDKEQRAAALVDTFNGLAGAVTAVTGVFTLLGAESEELGEIEKRILGLIAVTSGLRDVSDGLVAAQKRFGPVFAEGTAAVKAFFAAGTTGAKAFKVALASIGIGAIIIGITALIENYDELAAAISGVDEEQEALNQQYVEGEKNAVAQKVAIQGLVTQLNNNNLTERERLSIYNKLATSIPGLTKLQKLDTKAIEDATQAANTYIKVLQAKADAEVANQILIEANKKLLDVQNRGLADSANSFDEILSYLKSLITFQDAATIRQNRLLIQSDKYSTALKEAYRVIDVATEQRNKALETATKLENDYFISRGLGLGGEIEIAKTQKQLLEERLKLLDNATKRALAANELAARNDALRLQQEGATQEQLLKSQEKYQKQAETIVQNGATRALDILRGIDASRLVDASTTNEEAKALLDNYIKDYEFAFEQSAVKAKEITQQSNEDILNLRISGYRKNIDEIRKQGDRERELIGFVFDDVLAEFESFVDSSQFAGVPTFLEYAFPRIKQALQEQNTLFDENSEEYLRNQIEVNRQRTQDIVSSLQTEQLAVEQYYDALIKEANGDAVKIAELEAEKAEVFRAYQDAKKKIIEAGAQTEIDLENQITENAEENAQQRLETAKSVAQSILDLNLQIYQELSDLQQQNAQQRLDNELRNLDKLTQARIKAAGDDAEMVAKITEDSAKQEDLIRKRAFESEKQRKIALAQINTAAAVLSILAETPKGDFGIATAALIASALITAGIQTEAIRRTEYIPAYAEGGLVSGPGNGTSDSILARISNGEYIVNAQSTQRFLPVLDSINESSTFVTADGRLAQEAPIFKTYVLAGDVISATDAQYKLNQKRKL